MKISSDQVANVRDLNSGMSAVEARKLLGEIEGSLRSNDGTLRKGVLTLHRKGDGNYEMGVKRFALFQSSKNKKATAEFMTTLMEKAYGANANVGDQATTIGKASRFTVGGTVRNLVHLDKLQSSDPAEVTGQIRALEQHLTDDAKKIFGCLLTPQTSATVGTGQPPTYVLGDSDGSISRMLVMAVHSGHVALDESSLQKLADVINNEARALNNATPDKLEAFQKDPDNSQKLNDVLQEAAFRHSPNSLVFMGDIIHDRMSCDKQATADLVRKLHSNGAVFILGNHDSFEHCEGFGKGDPQVGRFAQRQLTRQDALALEQDCFVHAHFDGSKLYCHNGVEYDNTENQFVTAFGRFQADSPESLVAQMNASGPANESEDGLAKDFTSFRPKDNAMSKIGNQVEWARPIFFVHGHDDFHSQVGNVINLNARDNQGFSAVAMKM